MENTFLVGLAAIITAAGALYKTWRKAEKSDFDTLNDRLNAQIGRQDHALQMNEVLMNEQRNTQEVLQKQNDDLKIQVQEVKLQNIELKKKNLHLEEEKKLLIRQHNGLMEYLKLHNVPVPIFDKKGNIVAQPLDKDKEVG